MDSGGKQAIQVTPEIYKIHNVCQAVIISGEVSVWTNCQQFVMGDDLLKEGCRFYESPFRIE